MKRVALAATAVAATLAVGAATAGAAAEDSATGSGKAPNGAQWIVSAHGTPADARGNVIVETGPNLQKQKASVDCLNVQGNRAAISGETQDPITGTQGATRYVLIITDEGQGKNPPDRATFFARPAGQPKEPDCGFSEFGGPFGGGVPAAQGNFEIKDR